MVETGTCIRLAETGTCIHLAESGTCIRLAESGGCSDVVVDDPSRSVNCNGTSDEKSFGAVDGNRPVNLCFSLGGVDAYGLIVDGTLLAILPFRRRRTLTTGQRTTAIGPRPKSASA